MSSCCNSDPTTSIADACRIVEPPKNAAYCPECGRKGKPVQRITPEHLLKQKAVTRLKEGPYLFCQSAECPVVYFASEGGQRFHTGDVRVRVTQKVKDDPIPICYCFDYTEKMVADELAATGKTTIPERIRAEVQAGNCRCEVTNPQGSCCLGNVNRAVKKATAILGVTVPAGA